jgi:hypothetical protein
MKSTSLFLTHDLAIGNALSGFSFVALQPFSGRIQFALNDSTTFATAVQGAPAVPGPGTFVLLASTAVAIGVRRRLDTRSRKTQRPQARCK